MSRCGSAMTRIQTVLVRFITVTTVNPKNRLGNTQNTIDTRMAYDKIYIKNDV